MLQGILKRILTNVELRLPFGPPVSPDLNPFERVWHIMKNYLLDHFPENMSYDRLRAVVKEASDKVGQLNSRH